MSETNDNKIDKPMGVFVDWGNLKKETVRIDKSGKAVEMPSIEDRPKDLNELIKRRAERRGQ